MLINFDQLLGKKDIHTEKIACYKRLSDLMVHEKYDCYMELCMPIEAELTEVEEIDGEEGCYKGYFVNLIQEQNCNLPLRYDRAMKVRRLREERGYIRERARKEARNNKKNGTKDLTWQKLEANSILEMQEYYARSQEQDLMAIVARNGCCLKELRKSPSLLVKTACIEGGYKSLWMYFDKKHYLHNDPEYLEHVQRRIRKEMVTHGQFPILFLFSKDEEFRRTAWLTLTKKYKPRERDHTDYEFGRYIGVLP